MTLYLNWIIKTVFIVIIIIFIGIPFWILFGPFYIIIKTIVTIWQPYFHKKQSEKWNKLYQEYRMKGIYIDYPPSCGTFLGVGPWFKRDFD